MPVRISGSKQELVPMLKAIDGQRTLRELVTDVGGGQGKLEVYRQLYLADVIQLSRVPAGG